MDKKEILLNELQALASYEPDDLDNPEFEVAYEHVKSGEESFQTVCVIDLARRLEQFINQLLDPVIPVTDEIKKEDLQALEITELKRQIKDLTFNSNSSSAVQAREQAAIDNLPVELKGVIDR